jgi:cytochrome bd ubiquinol oxidase subunit I
MDTTALLLSRIQFAFTITFHIIFPSFTIGLAAWLTVLEAMCLATGRLAYRVLFEFWLKIFGVAFGLGVVSGIVMHSSSARTGARSQKCPDRSRARF